MSNRDRSCSCLHKNHLHLQSPNLRVIYFDFKDELRLWFWSSIDLEETSTLRLILDGLETSKSSFENLFWNFTKLRNPSQVRWFLRSKTIFYFVFINFQDNIILSDLSIHLDCHTLKWNHFYFENEKFFTPHPTPLLVFYPLIWKLLFNHQEISIYTWQNIEPLSK